MGGGPSKIIEKNIINMKNYPKITVVTPSFNQGEFLEETIHSIIDQGYPNLEYIICDGGSSDNSIDIIKKYGDSITWWCSERDKGQTDAINKGMHRATGDIVGWINSDDVLFPNSLYLIAEFYNNHKKCEFINGMVAQINRDGTIKRFVHTIMSKFFMKHGCYNICQQGMFWKRSLFDKLGYLDDTFHAKMDVEWLIRNYEANTVVMSLNKPLGAIRVYNETKTAMGGYIWERDAAEIRKKYCGKYSPVRSGFIWYTFILCKFLKGCYLKNWLMCLKYKGKYYWKINKLVQRVKVPREPVN